MAIPEHVKRQAMDAVSHKETTAMIRAMNANAAPVSHGDVFAHSKPSVPETRPIPDEVKRQAMDAVSHPETRAQIKLVKDTGEISCPLTPSREKMRIADKIARLHKSGHDLDATHRAMTQDHFGKEPHG
ncbi:MAG TPA: hypothetical protein VGO59_11660 [Verrucomicrobiae bacterium]|jgi:hypothetical protein